MGTEAVRYLKDWPQRSVVLMQSSVRLTGNFLQPSVTMPIGNECMRRWRKHKGSKSGWETRCSVPNCQARWGRGQFKLHAHQD